MAVTWNMYVKILFLCGNVFWYRDFAYKDKDKTPHLENWNFHSCIRRPSFCWNRPVVILGMTKFFTEDANVTHTLTWSIPTWHHDIEILHYNVIMSATASQITGVSSVYSTVCSCADHRNIKAPRHWPLWRKTTGDRWIPLTKGQ